MRSAQNGLQIAGNLNDLYCENLSTLRDEFRKVKESTLRVFDLFEARLQVADDMLRANNRIVSAMDSALRVEVDTVSIAEEEIVYENDLPDYDHA